MMHVHIMFEHGEDLKPFGVAYIRDILPLTHPTNAESFQVTYGLDYTPADIIILERAWKPKITLEQAEQLVKQVRSGQANSLPRPYLLYTIDDNLLDLNQVPLPSRQAVHYFCRHADGILTSTTYLKERLQRLNPRIALLPNCLDERLFTEHGQRLQPGRNEDSCRIIGFMGTFTHDADLMMILQALRTVLRRHMDTLQLQITGGIGDSGLLRLLHGLPVRVLNPAPTDAAYPNFVPWMKKNLIWDIGIAPLEDTVFNLSKSDIKFLDYSALGIPGIYSRVPSYTDTVRHMESGYLADNTPDTWVEALEWLLADPALRTRLAMNAQEYVFTQRSLQARADLWREAILSFIPAG